MFPISGNIGHIHLSLVHLGDGLLSTACPLVPLEEHKHDNMSCRYLSKKCSSLEGKVGKKRPLDTEFTLFVVTNMAIEHTAYPIHTSFTYIFKMVLFYSYVSLPEGVCCTFSNICWPLKWMVQVRRYEIVPRPSFQISSSGDNESFKS